MSSWKPCKHNLCPYQWNQRLQRLHILTCMTIIPTLNVHLFRNPKSCTGAPRMNIKACCWNLCGMRITLSSLQERHFSGQISAPTPSLLFQQADSKDADNCKLSGSYKGLCVVFKDNCSCGCCCIHNIYELEMIQRVIYVAPAVGPAPFLLTKGFNFTYSKLFLRPSIQVGAIPLQRQWGLYSFRYQVRPGMMEQSFI